MNIGNWGSGHDKASDARRLQILGKAAAALGQLSTEPSPIDVKDCEFVEIPLDPLYLTDEGMYQAGYRSGQKGQHWGPKEIMDKFPPLFQQGHADGYGDWLRRFEEESKIVKGTDGVRYLKKD